MFEAVNAGPIWFKLGQKVNLALPLEVALKPQQRHFKVAAQALGIRVSEARAAWNFFTWGGKAPNRYPTSL